MRHADAIRAAGDVQQLGAGWQAGGGLGAQFVETVGTLAAAGDQQRRAGGIQAQACGGLRPRRQLQDFRAGRRAGRHCGGPWKKFPGGLHAEEHPRAKPRGEHIGAAGAGVGIVNERLQAEPVAGVYRGQRGEPAHAQHRIRPELTDEPLALAQRAPQPPHKWQHARRARRRLGHGRHGRKAQLRIVRAGLGIHRFFRNQQQRLVTPRQQRLRHRNAGEEVTACATTGNEDFTGLGHGQGGDKTAGGMRKISFATPETDLKQILTIRQSRKWS